MNLKSQRVTVSIVSHNHGQMVWRLVDQIAQFGEIEKIIITLNVPELVPVNLPENVFLIQNSTPKGFGENHNAAFNFNESDFYCILNPDIFFNENPFPRLLSIFTNNSCGLVAPIIVSTEGFIADTTRQHLTPLRLLSRLFGLNQGIHLKKLYDDLVMSDWIAGMFMLIRSEVFDRVGGFDKKYFMYCEDADLCKRVWGIGYSIIVSLSVSTVHAGQRASHRNLHHFIWHCQSLFKYFLTHSN